MEEEPEERQVIVKHIDFKPMDVDEAAMQLELLPNNFLVFTNARTGRVNVLYRRKDGDFGLIQPQP
jgi:putative sigma-54 modulation protein